MPDRTTGGKAGRGVQHECLRRRALRTADRRTCAPPERPRTQLQQGTWELLDENGDPLHPLPTPESKVTSPASVYALSKYDQERLCLLVGQAYNIPTIAPRFFNVYGTRQALSNPYTCVLPIFASRFLNGNSPLIFEDGEQKRDFVNVQDVVQACVLALERDEAAGRVFNVGSGRSHTVREIAEHMGRLLGREEIRPVITRQYRVGDIRHCFADIGEARSVLGYQPRIGLEEGMGELTEWLKTQAALDRFEAANEELSQRGLRL